MSIEDLEYVERVTRVSLDQDKPLYDIKYGSTQKANERKQELSTTTPSQSGLNAGVQKSQQPEYDWFDFFLQCGVNPLICERYAQSFERDQMGEENMPDIAPHLLRTLGLKEGDILRVMRYLDNEYGRAPTAERRSVSFDGVYVMVKDDAESAEAGKGAAGGLFSGPGGMLRNNTRKGRSAPPFQMNDVVDPKVFEQRTGDAARGPQDATATPVASPPASPPTLRRPAASRLDDNAWKPRESKAPAPPAIITSPPPQTSASAPAPAPAISAPPEVLAGLDLLTPPLIPTPVPQLVPAPQTDPSPVLPRQSQLTVATPLLFEQPARAPPAQQQQSTGVNPPQLTPQQFTASRQRPQPPQQTQATGSMIAPLPARASSVPQNLHQQSTFGRPSLQPQHTGSLYPALVPQRTGVTTFTSGYGGQGGYMLPPVPAVPQQQTMAPLVLQKTRPPPLVRFGVGPAANMLMPQETRRRANLSRASKCIALYFSVPCIGTWNSWARSSAKSVWFFRTLRSPYH